MNEVLKAHRHARKLCGPAVVMPSLKSVCRLYVVGAMS